MYLLDEDVTDGRLLAIATDGAGDTYALDLDRPTAKGDYPVVHLTHDPLDRRKVAPRFRPWVVALLRDELA
jgi:hypothetical protein